MHATRNNRRWMMVAVVVLGLIGVVPVTGAVTGDRAEAAVARTGDGTSSSTAGASCWGIKAQHPDSGNGTYWVLTAAMDRPVEVVCDMSTDGGGWALVARGRNGWTFDPDGQGRPASITAQPDGPEAFGPAALSTEAINVLLGRAPVSSLADGVRLERAITADGATRQDYRLFLRSRSWTWNLPAGQLLDRVSVDGAAFAGSNTQDSAGPVIGQKTNGLANVQDARRLYTKTLAGRGDQAGFGLGTSVAGGSSSATNFLWTAGAEGAPLGFTRVWVRPRIANDGAGFTPIPATGFAAEAKPLGLKNRSELAPWGVEGYNHDNEDRVDPWRDNVMVIKVYGDRVYVGGRFRTVKNGPGGAEFTQGSLAAFDLDGNWISTFRPQIPGRVWDMTMTDDGKLIVGGDFPSVNGAPDTSGMAALDPVTGQVDSSWTGSVTRDSGNVIVRSLDSKGPWVYAAGRFNRFKGGASNAIAVTNAISMKASNGGPGPWHPKIYASAISMRVSAAADRVYMAGYFNAVNGDRNHGYYAITNNTDGAPVAGMGPFQPSTTGAKYQQAVAENGNDILVGGSEHDIQQYDHDRQNLLASTITKNGGDTQAIEKIGDYVYASCHCMNWIYQGTNTWPTPTGYRSVDPIRMIGRFDAKTMEYDTSWHPDGTKGTNDAGIWSISSDRRQCLWVGGDLIRGAYSGNAARDYLGGFARFCPTDATAPTAPTDLIATTSESAVDLSWKPATDDSGSVTYDVYRNDRVIATISGTTFSDTTAQASSGPYRYTVRAADARGNRSASLAPVTVDGPAPVVTVLAAGSTWAYWYQDDAPAPGWQQEGYDATGWSSGAGELGFGDGQATVITTASAPRPITSYYRRTVDISAPSGRYAFDLVANAGAVVTVNGVEVARANVRPGPVDPGTYAMSTPPRAERHTPVRFEVPASALHPGTNTIAVEVHNGYRSAPTMGFDLAVTKLG